jgi:hypothetical protein
MLRRGLLAAAIAGLLGTVSARAAAAEAWITNATIKPVEQRVAIAATPGRTTVWTSLRFDAAAGRTAIIVPAPPGSALDISSDAWFEALEVATAPRIFPPANVDPFCPGKSGPADVFQLDGQVGHVTSLAPLTLAVLDDVPKLASWTQQQGITLPPSTASTLSLLGDVRFVTVVFDTPAGTWLTPTLRVAMPGEPPWLPLALTQAGTSDLAVTVWAFGPGRADLIGATEVLVPPATVTWNAKDETTDYEDKKSAVLASEATRFLIEASSHNALGQTMSIGSGTATIDSVVSTFFERAAAYGDGNFDASACLALAEPALETAKQVAPSCPHAGLGVIDPASTCTESPTASQIDPANLRCGAGADDLAVALSGLTASTAVVTRAGMVIPANGAGLNWPLGFAAGPAVSPLIHAGTVDTSTCDNDGGSSSSSSSSSSASSGHGSSSSSSGHPSTSSGVIFHDTDPDTGVEIDIDLEDVFDAATNPDGTCSCGGTGTASGDSCSSDTSGSSSCSSDTSASASDACSNSSGDSSSCSGDGSGSDSCSSSSGSGDSCSSGSSGESCSGGGGGESCSGGGGSGCSGGGDSFKCTTAGHRPRAPRFSILLVAGLAVLAPLRRAGRKRRDAERAARRAASPR